MNFSSATAGSEAREKAARAEHNSRRRAFKAISGRFDELRLQRRSGEKYGGVERATGRREVKTYASNCIGK